MTLTMQKRKELGQSMTERIFQKHNIQARQVENKEDLFSKNIVATFKPRKNSIVVKSK